MSRREFLFSPDLTSTATYTTNKFFATATGTISTAYGHPAPSSFVRGERLIYYRATPKFTGRRHRRTEYTIVLIIRIQFLKKISSPFDIQRNQRKTEQPIKQYATIKTNIQHASAKKTQQKIRGRLQLGRCTQNGTPTIRRQLRVCEDSNCAFICICTGGVLFGYDYRALPTELA